MESKEQKRFDSQYRRHLRALKLQGKSDSTIDVYARAVRRIAGHFDCCPDRLTTGQLEEYFAKLVESHSWSTVKVDRNGLQFFWKHVLRLDWSWVKIIKPPKIHSLPDILTLAEIERLIGATRKLRYRVFLLTTYSMGLRLGEALPLANRCISAVARAIRTAWFRCPTSLTRHFAPYGASTATPGCCSPIRSAPPSAFATPPPTWIEAAPKRP